MHAGFIVPIKTIIGQWSNSDVQVQLSKLKTVILFLQTKFRIHMTGLKLFVT